MFWTSQAKLLWEYTNAVPIDVLSVLVLLFLCVAQFYHGLQYARGGSPAFRPKMPSDADVQNDGTYTFKYASWVDKTGPDSFHFIRMVDTDNDCMFVDWKGTNIFGFAQRDRPLVATLPGASDHFHIQSTDLWYGAGLTKITAKYKEESDAAQENQTLPFERPQWRAKEADDTKEVPRRRSDTGKGKPDKRSLSRPLVSTIQLGVARAPNPRATAGDIRAVSVRFSSEVVLEGQGQEPESYLYRYSFHDANYGTRAKFPVYISSNSNDVQVALGHQDPPKPDLAVKVLLDDLPRGGHLESKEPPRIRVCNLLFRNGDGQIVGSAPVSIYRPRGVGETEP